MTECHFVYNKSHTNDPELKSYRRGQKQPNNRMIYGPVG
jgi:hypothetical protein